MPVINKQARKKRERYSDNHRERQFIYQRREWRELRRAKLRDNPMCECCEDNGRSTPAEDVHHIDSFMHYSGDERYRMAYEYSNLMSLCKQCHKQQH